jgi:hypothetical protein
LQLVEEWGLLWLYSAKKELARANTHPDGRTPAEMRPQGRP